MQLEASTSALKKKRQNLHYEILVDAPTITKNLNNKITYWKIKTIN